MLIFDAKICTGCRICEQTCFQVHYQGTAEDNSKIKMVSHWPEEEVVSVCRQCSNPKCLEACPTEALHQVNGVIQVDREKCTQCYLCFDACPFEARVIDQKGYPIFCDTCTGKYLCAQMCPAKAVKRGGHQ
ncbi:4Fe-4S binding protein [Desulfosporosinus sp. BICA1-9]|uniref:4Fe-4S binding protein n=1 Tax=Desulfosporosinus sp. BICA1-9 TaxID=1531958 RepID=UPI00054BA57A|nr:4Fe-4S binding protein [Desulfosporosinus sp. BICA1-9]KJS90167.1 MAG: hypothetical protein JL57_03015 [Desulfosporosinus sp. BICA1-9]HBW38940.1 hypothetical protein [Desulfosporosinus sp.]